MTAKPTITARRAGDLVSTGVIEPARAADVDRVAERYAMAVTHEMLALIDPVDASDPIARQFVPDLRELTRRPEERDDPIGDHAHSPVKGIVHRYPDRVLLKPTHVCPVYCRFCFRREMVGPGGEALGPEELAAALAYIRDHKAIWEVIVTGGDPLMLAPRRLGHIVKALEAIGQVQVVRIHTRVPLVDPRRITPALVDALGCDKALYVLVHANHPREFTRAARAALKRLVAAGIPLLGQSVLLKGVNADVETLALLMRTFVQHRVKPYYLHHPDLAPGTSHFRLSIVEGQALVRALRGRLSGLAQPTYVLDIPGGHGKSPIGPGYQHPDGTIEDWRGQKHAYPRAESDGPLRVAKPSALR